MTTDLLDAVKAAESDEREREHSEALDDWLEALELEREQYGELDEQVVNRTPTPVGVTRSISATVELPAAGSPTSPGLSLSPPPSRGPDPQSSSSGRRSRR